MFIPVDWSAIIFNPSFPYRLVHMTLAAFITTCFVIGGVSAWYLRRGIHLEPSRRLLKLAIAFALVAVPAQEIGSAACRERVCQSVYISVGAGSLKKKPKQ